MHMADQILTAVFDVASDIETEAGNLKACVELMERALQFSYVEPKAVERAQAQMIFLTSCIGDIRQRLDAISGAAYGIHSVGRAMEPDAKEGEELVRHV
jgi:hypothetical protein